MTNFSTKLNILRAAVLGANDGIISIAGVVIGVATASSNTWLLFLTGAAAILAGAFSMAGGEYVSVSTQKDTEKAATHREWELYHQSPELARESLYTYYVQDGHDDSVAQQMVKKAFATNPVRHLVEAKYNIEYDMFSSPWHAAISSFAAFFAGSIFPMLSVLLLPISVRIWGTIIVVALALVLTGYTSAKLGDAPIRPAIRRNVFFGLLTMSATYLIGLFFGM
ncbi:VIT1/CCC1 transporter family protein [Streptococcus hyovaginalis]|uniref:VIT1/CCC1 transporter family protein n=1 Tax=Streptococcus hyovaginalis TaxID=149015 RepID=UPI003AD3EDCE